MKKPITLAKAKKIATDFQNGHSVASKSTKSVKKAPVKKKITKEASWKKKALDALKKESGEKCLRDGKMDVNFISNENAFYAICKEGIEYIIFKTYSDAEYYAEKYVESMLDDEPELFSKDWLENHYYVSDTDRRIIAGEEADRRVEDFEDESRHDEDDEDEVKDFEEKKEELHDEVYNEWYDGLKHPVQFLVEEQGLYSMEDLSKINFLQIDTREAARQAVNDDGLAHFISTYDGNEIELEGGFYAYRVN